MLLFRPVMLGDVLSVLIVIVGFPEISTPPVCRFDMERVYMILVFVVLGVVDVTVIFSPEEVVSVVVCDRLFDIVTSKSESLGYMLVVP